MKKRRQWTTYSGSGKRVAPRTRTSRVSRGKEMGVPRLWVQLIVCGALFVALIGLKLLMPGNLSALRGTLGQWLVRDADFISAFSAVGRAASGEQDWGDSLSEAYVAVFGGESKAQEVSGNLIGMTVSEQDVSDLTSARELPALAVGEQRILGFSYTTPLSGTVTSPFGWRDDPNGAGECFHYGMDIAGEEGASVACFADGTVGTVGESNILGNYVTVNHEGGFSTLYAHCSAITASAGQSVKKGDAIAKVGSTGNATGSHLHFEVHDGEEYLNPVYYAVPLTRAPRFVELLAAHSARGHRQSDHDRALDFAGRRAARVRASSGAAGIPRAHRGAASQRVWRGAARARSAKALLRA